MKCKEECKFEHHEKALELCLNDENGPYNINKGKYKNITANLKAHVEQVRAQRMTRHMFGHGIPMTAPTAASGAKGIALLHHLPIFRQFFHFRKNPSSSVISGTTVFF